MAYFHIMRSLTLCRERLARIERVLNKNAGALTIREFDRSFGVWEWELEQAAALGRIQIETHQPHRGRPSRVVRQVSEPKSAKLPPYRWQIEKPISHRHFCFAIASLKSFKRGRPSYAAAFGLGDWGCRADAYQNVYKAARSRAGARASVSRLIRHPDVRAARAWLYAKVRREIPMDDAMPDTARAIWQRLRELGSWRVSA